jgi:hypothetical protein
MYRACLVVFALLSGNGFAEAQELATSFNQLRVLVKPGDTITVTDTVGREVRGSIAELSDTSLVLLVGGNRRDMPADEVSVIRQRRPDSLANGAKWGLGIGVGLGLLGVAAVASEDDVSDVGFAVLGVLLYGAMGAGIGVGIDAMISSDQVIFAARRSTAIAREAARPGLSLSFRF